MKKYSCVVLIIVINFIAVHVFAQTDTLNKPGLKKQFDTVTVSGKEKAISNNVVKITKRLTPVDSEFVINNKRLKYYNNWLTVGGGEQQNLTYKRKLGFAGGVDFNFHIKQYYFQLGTMLSGERFGSYNDYQLHFCYGKRYENKIFHYAAFAGVSYSSGFGKVGDTVYTRKFNQPGVYFEGEIVKKVTYDVGVGASLFMDLNSEQTIIGLRLMVFFSGAYLGKKNGRYEEN